MYNYWLDLLNEWLEYAAASTPAHQPSRIRSRQPAGSPIRYPKRRDLVSGPIANVTAAATSAMATMPK